MLSNKYDASPIWPKTNVSKMKLYVSRGDDTAWVGIVSLAMQDGSGMPWPYYYGA